MSESVYDVIVVGAGVEGSSTAWQLSRRGVKVLLLEQFHLPHTRGSSHGTTRIIRKAYPNQIYTEMMDYNMATWKQIQEETGQTIFKNMGYLNIGILSSKPLQDDMKAMTSTNASFVPLTPEKFRQKFPQFNYDNDVGAVHDLEGGILYADKCLQIIQRLFVTNGGVVKDGEKVENIQPGSTVRVITTKSTFTCQSLILCCGPWTNHVLKTLQLQLPLTTHRISACYWPEKVPGSFSADNTVPFSERMERSVTYPFHTYGLPSNEYPGHFKFCLHNGPEVDPERRDNANIDWVINLLKIYVNKHFPGLVPEPSIVEPCYYTMTPDRDFILDSHPKWKNILIGAGFSGHGFKHGPAVGDILADLALNKKPKYDIRQFRINRFDTANKSKL